MLGRTSPATRPRSRRLLLVGSLLTVVGLAVVATAPVAREASTLGGARAVTGGVALLAGWLVLVVGIHRFGREAGAATAGDNGS